MIHVVAIITARPGHRDKVLAIFEANVPAVRAEDGCIEYGAATDIDVFGSGQALFGPDSFVVIEKWATPEHLRTHAASPHMKEYGAKTRELLAGRTVHVVEPTK